MLVVSDTTALTTLLKCGEESVLQQLFGSLVVPEAVWSELIRFHPFLPSFVSMRKLDAPEQRLEGTETLGRGEAEALKLATQIRADLVLTDDKQARRAAMALGIPVSGTLGILVLAKRRGCVKDVRLLIEKLEAKGNLYLSESVKAEALRAAGEN